MSYRERIEEEWRRTGLGDASNVAALGDSLFTKLDTAQQLCQTFTLQDGAVPLNPGDPIFAQLFGSCKDTFGGVYFDVLSHAQILVGSDDLADDISDRLIELQVVQLPEGSQPVKPVQRSGVVHELLKCEVKGSAWAASAVDSLTTALDNLAQSLAVAALKSFLQPDDYVWHGKAWKEGRLESLLDTFKGRTVPPEAQAFAVLCRAALCCATPLKDFRISGPKAGHPLKNAGNYVILMCRALAFACMWFCKMMESRASMPYSTTRIQSGFKIFMDHQLAEVKSKDISFLRKVDTEWAAADEEAGGHLSLQSLWKREGAEYLDVMECICARLAAGCLSGSHDNDASDPLYLHLFEDTRDSFGRALWEVLEYYMRTPSPHFDLVARAEGAIKALSLCIQAKDKWSGAVLVELNGNLRKLAEVLVKATYLMYKDQSYLTKEVKKGKIIRREEKGFSEQASELFDLSITLYNVQALAALCKAAHKHTCPELHAPGKDIEPECGNVGRNTIFSCRALVLACKCFADMVVASMPRSQVKMAYTEQGIADTEYQRRMDQLEDAGTVKEKADEPGAMSSFSKIFSELKSLYNRAYTGAEELESLLSEYRFFLDSVMHIGGQNVERNQIIQLMEDIVVTSAGFVRSVDTGIWLHRVLAGKDDKHFQDIQSKLAELVRLLDAAMTQPGWLPEDPKKAADLKKGLRSLKNDVAIMEGERQDRKEMTLKIRDALLGEARHVEGLQEFIVYDEEKLSTDSRARLNPEVLHTIKKAAAFARAKFDNPTLPHHKINHPDMLVMWHRAEELKTQWHAGWDTFVNYFPTALVIDEELRRKVNRKRDKYKPLLTNAGSDTDDNEEDVTTEKINCIFEWRIGSRIGLLDVLRLKSKSTSSRTSGVHTPTKGSEQPAASSLPGKPQKLSEFEANYGSAQSTPFSVHVGRDHESSFAASTLMDDSSKPHLLTTGPPGIGKSASCSNIIDNQKSEGTNPAGIMGSLSLDLGSACNEGDLCNVLVISSEVTCGEVDKKFAGRLIREMERVAARSPVSPSHTAQPPHSAISQPPSLASSSPQLPDSPSSPQIPPPPPPPPAPPPPGPPPPTHSKPYIVFLDSCEVPLAREGTAHILAQVLLHVSEFMPMVRLIMASCAVELEGKPGSEAHPFHYAPSLHNIFVEMKLAPLAPEVGMHILRRGFRSMGSDDGKAMALAEKCGNPLQLQLAAGVLSAGLAGFEDVQRDLAAPDKSGGVEAALLRRHKAVHLEALYSLSLFPASVSTRQALFMLDDLPDAESAVQELHSRRLISALPSKSGEQQWGVHASVRAAVQGPEIPASPDQAADWQAHRASAHTAFVKCMVAELARCAWASPRRAARFAQVQRPNLCAALGPACQLVSIRTSVSQELLKAWPAFSQLDSAQVESIGRVAGLLLPSLEQLCTAAAQLNKEWEGKSKGRREAGSEVLEESELLQCVPKSMGLDEECHLVLLGGITEPPPGLPQLLQGSIRKVHGLVSHSHAQRAAAALVAAEQQQQQKLKHKLEGTAEASEYPQASTSKQSGNQGDQAHTAPLSSSTKDIPEAETDASEKREECPLCWSKPVEMGFLHGGSSHICACAACAANFKVGDPCPYCKAKIDLIFRAFNVSRTREEDAPQRQNKRQVQSKQQGGSNAAASPLARGGVQVEEGHLKPQAPASFYCPVSMELMADPVIVATGQTYDRICVERWFKQGNRTCPSTGSILPHLQLVPNWALGNAIQEWAHNHDIMLGPSAGQHWRNAAAAVQQESHQNTAVSAATVQKEQPSTSETVLGKQKPQHQGASTSAGSAPSKSEIEELEVLRAKLAAFELREQEQKWAEQKYGDAVQRCGVTMSGHSSSVNSMAFTPDGATLLTGSKDYTLKLWNVASGCCYATLSGHSLDVRGVAIMKDGCTAASGSKDNSVMLWDLVGGCCTATLTGHTDWVLCVAFCPDGTSIASGSGDRTIRIWSVSSLDCTATLEHSDAVLGIAFSPDNTRLASGSSDATARVWDISSSKCVAVLQGHRGTVASVVFSLDGTQVLSASYDDTICVWNATTGVRMKTMTGHGNCVVSVTLTPDGTKAVSGSDDCTIKYWDWKGTGLCIGTLTGHGNSVNSVLVSPSGRLLASSSRDKTTKLWFKIRDDDKNREYLIARAAARGAITNPRMGPGSDFLEFAITDHARLVLAHGEITEWDGDALVNAANEHLSSNGSSGGVGGAIHRAAGPGLLQACSEVRQISGRIISGPGVRCPTGEARITPGFNLKAKYVIHTVGPIFERTADLNSARLLANAYRNSMRLANEHKVEAIAFPAISTGAYGYPVAAAAEVSLHAITMSVGQVKEVHFVLYDQPTFIDYLTAACAIFGDPLDKREPEKVKEGVLLEENKLNRFGPHVNEVA